MVQLELSQIYFFIDYEIEENEVWLGQHAVVWQIFTFMAVCSGVQDSPNKRIVSASLMIPPYISESGQWEMMALKEIWLASQKKKKGRFFVYLAENGKRYTEQSGIKDLSDSALEHVERYFPLSSRDTCKAT